jgi:hypothetical protein
MPYDYSTALDAARTELARLRRERQQLDLEITKHERLVATLSLITGEDEDASQAGGFTDAVRQILHASSIALTPVEVRDRLNKAGFDFKYTNLLANVHVVLKRLVQSREAIAVTPANEIGQRYWWSLNGAPVLPKAGVPSPSLKDVAAKLIAEGKPSSGLRRRRVAGKGEKA